MRYRIATAVALLSLWAVGCHKNHDSGDGVIPPGGDIPFNVNGTWSGTTSQGEAAKFVITNGGLEQIEMWVNVCDPIGIGLLFAFTPAPVIDKDNTITFSQGQHISGTVNFSSSNQASGAITTNGQSKCPDSVSFTFTAKK